MTTTITNKVAASRLELGSWCHLTNRQIGEGDIAGAYSADTIAMHGQIRSPFKLDGWLCTTVSMSGKLNDTTATAYRLIDANHYEGTTKSYGESIRQPKDELGSYHGVAVSHGNRRYVIVGPPIAILRDMKPEPVQTSLF
ncbi:MAG: hypothetical protein AAGA30_09305 [Planctomycetota bacterium]